MKLFIENDNCLFIKNGRGLLENGRLTKLLVIDVARHFDSCQLFVWATAVTFYKQL